MQWCADAHRVRRTDMAVRKAAKKKAVKKSAKKARKQTPPLTLPAFGLAEEILAGAQTDVTTGEAGGYQQELQDLIQQATSAESQGPEAGPHLHLVTFNLDTEEYGVDIESVQEIIRVGQITPVPNAAEVIEGVINLRGRVIPVINLRRKLSLADGTLTKNSRIMIVEAAAKVLGMLVDAVSQVLWMPVASVEAPPEEVERSKAYVRGIGKLDSRLIMLMDLESVLARDSSSPG